MSHHCPRASARELAGPGRATASTSCCSGTRRGRADRFGRGRPCRRPLPDSPSRPTVPSTPSTTPSPTRPELQKEERAMSRTDARALTRATSRPAMGRWSATTGRPRRSAGSRSSSSPSGSAASSARRPSTRTPPGPGESGRMDRILDAGFKQPAAESVLIQSHSLASDRPGVQRRGRRTSSRGISKLARRPERPLAARRRQRGPDLEGRARGARRVRDPRRRGQGGRQDRSGPRRASTSSQQAHPQFFIGEFGDASAVRRGRDGVRGRPRQGRAALAPDHADHPRARVRRARGRGHPAAARADRRVRDVRAARAAEPRCCRWRCRRRRWCS